MGGGGMASDEEAPLTEKAEKRVHCEESDSELEGEGRGGRFKSKFAVLQVTFRLPLTGPVHFVTLVYGFLPFIVPAVLFIHWLIFRHRIALYGACLNLFGVVLNELVLKKILNQPRPRESANKFKDEKDGQMKMKPGMPSGHVLNSTLVMVWATLEVAFAGPGFDEDHIFTSLEWLAIVLLLMAPVPWARWKNKDHTLNQCLVAGMIGILLGIIAFICRIMFVPVRWTPWMDAPMLNATNTTTTSIVANSTLPPVVESTTILGGLSSTTLGELTSTTVATVRKTSSTTVATVHETTSSSRPATSFE